MSLDTELCRIRGQSEADEPPTGDKVHLIHEMNLVHRAWDSLLKNSEAESVV